MVYLLPTKKEILIWDNPKITLGNNGDAIPAPTYRVKRPFSFWRYRNLRKRSIIIGFVGSRGSGKSVGAARTVILDYMLRGKTVWSNMEIGFNLISNGQIIPVKSKPLEKMSLVDLDSVYSDGVIYIDEVNLLAEARRSMSKENVMFSYILQQLRKRRLSIIWSAQSENHCDDRLRFQSDIFILCEDVSINRPNCDIGAYSRWKAHDYSGVVKGKTSTGYENSAFYRATMWNKPWWNMYNTWQLQEVGANEQIKQEEDAIRAEVKRIAGEMADYMKRDAPREQAPKLWRKWRVATHKMKILIGVELSQEHGIIKENYDPNSRWYVVDEDLIDIGVE